MEQSVCQTTCEHDITDKIVSCRNQKILLRTQPESLKFSLSIRKRLNIFGNEEVNFWLICKPFTIVYRVYGK